MNVRTRFNQVWSELNEAARLAGQVVRNDAILDTFSEHEDRLFVSLIANINEARAVARDLAIELILDDEDPGGLYPNARESRRIELLKNFDYAHRR